MDERRIQPIYEGMFQTETFESAHELINILRLSNSTWQTNDGEWHRLWYFRGQARADWELIPSAWRLKTPLMELGRNRLRYVNAAIKRTQEKFPDFSENLDWNRIRYAAQQVTFELTLVRDFVELADVVGYHVPLSNIPSVNPDLIDQIVEDLALTKQDGIHRTIWSDPAIALAQHHDIPTRLLDWTLNPLAAAYFAASDVLSQRIEDGYLAIYAMHQYHLKGGRVIEVKHADNPFLRAQEGIFIVDLEADIYFLQNGYYPSLMESRFRLGTIFEPAYRPRKYLLPVSQAEELMRLLTIEKVTRAHLMPTLDNVARTVKDQWQLIVTRN